MNHQYVLLQDVMVQNNITWYIKIAVWMIYESSICTTTRCNGTVSYNIIYKNSSLNDIWIINMYYYNM